MLMGKKLLVAAVDLIVQDLCQDENITKCCG